MLGLLEFDIVGRLRLFCLPNKNPIVKESNTIRTKNMLFLFTCYLFCSGIKVKATLAFLKNSSPVVSLYALLYTTLTIPD